MSEGMVRLSWQDYRHHVPGVGMEKPTVMREDFRDRAAAEAKLKEVTLLGGPDVVACITPIIIRRRRKQRKDGEFIETIKEWRMHR